MLSVSRRTSWTAPYVERAVSLVPLAFNLNYNLGDHFQLLTREPGSQRHDLPVWVSTLGAVQFESTWGPVQRTDLPNVEGAFVLSNVLTPAECDQVHVPTVLPP